MTTSSASQQTNHRQPDTHRVSITDTVLPRTTSCDVHDVASSIRGWFADPAMLDTLGDLQWALIHGDDLGGLPSLLGLRVDGVTRREPMGLAGLAHQWTLLDPPRRQLLAEAAADLLRQQRAEHA